MSCVFLPRMRGSLSPDQLHNINGSLDHEMVAMLERFAMYSLRCNHITESRSGGVGGRTI